MYKFQKLVASTLVAGMAGTWLSTATRPVAAAPVVSVSVVASPLFGTDAESWTWSAFGASVVGGGVGGAAGGAVGGAIGCCPAGAGAGAVAGAVGGAVAGGVGYGATQLAAWLFGGNQQQAAPAAAAYGMRVQPDYSSAVLD